MNRDFNIKLIYRLLGSLLLIESIFLFSTIIISFIFNENDWSYFLLTGLICVAVGLLAIWGGRNARDTIGKREGSLFVTLIWVVFSLFGLLPFWLSNSIPSFTDAFFETISGFTTTGATILTDIESLSYSMLFWRSLTQWIGGLGIIVISLALLPIFGFSGTQLFAAESTGPTKDKIHPKITGTAKRLFLIYLLLTVSQTVLLMVGGMNWFDAICHSFTTISTGGFSTKQNSIMYWESAYIQYVIILFMLLSGVNLSLYYFLGKLKFSKITKNEELKAYIIIVLIFTLIITFSILDLSQLHPIQHLEKAFRDALFQVSAIITTTGYATTDYTLWKPVTWIVLLLAMITGASAGSTAGGVKLIRIVIVFKFCYYEFKRFIHPNAVLPVRYNEHIVKDDIMTRILAFVTLYLMIAAFGILILTISGMGFLESVGGLISCLGDVGPGLGTTGPMGSYADIPTFSKWFLALIMLVGRLELFTVLLLFTPVFWKK